MEIRKQNQGEIKMFPDFKNLINLIISQGEGINGDPKIEAKFLESKQKKKGETNSFSKVSNME